MPAPARIVAYELLRRIELNRVRSDDALNSPLIATLAPRDRSLVTEIVYGSLRWQSFLDYLLARAAARSWDSVDPEVKILLRMGLYQMWGMDRVPNHALLNDAVEIAKRALSRGTGGFINGILRRVARDRPWECATLDQECPQNVRVSLPAWLWARWSLRFGAALAREYALSLNETPLEASRFVESELMPEQFSTEMRRSDLVPGAVLRHRSGNRVEVTDRSDRRFQDEASQLIPHLFGDIRAQRILDVCAAPGGKSAILSEMAGSAENLVLADRSWPRLTKLVRSLDPGRKENIKVLVADAVDPMPLRVSFDAVMADVPCSGLGTLRRNPEIKWRFDQERFPLLQARQLRILLSAAAVVRPGGLLLYSTCSTEPEENEQVVSSFLAAHPEFCLKVPTHPPGIADWVDPSGMVRTFPSARLWDGFFAALMIRAA